MLTTVVALPTLRSTNQLISSGAGLLPGPYGGTIVRLSMRPRRRTLSFLALLATFALLVAACGGGGSDKKGGGDTTSSDGKPVPGGKVVYGLEGGTTSFCLPRAQLAIAGIMVAQSVYDTLTEPNDKSESVPYLAKSVEPNATFDEWTITLRPGITFHDGTPLNAAAVAQNINAWKAGLLLGFVFGNIDTVTTPDNMTVVVKTKVPWVAFPAYLWSTGRTGIAAPAQLNNDATCDTNMIGTGPFKLKDFNPTTGDVDVVKNPNYWRKGFPYLDEIQWKIQEDGDQRVNGLQGGQFDVIHDDAGKNLKTIEGFGGGFTTDLEPAGYRESGQALLNVTRPPLNDLNIRRAMAMGTDRDALNQIANDGKWTISNSVYDSKVTGAVKDSGYPQHNTAEAKKLVNAYKNSHGGQAPTFSLQSTFDQVTQALAKEVKRQMNEVGIKVNLPAPVDQATIINQAIGSQVDSFLWRNYPGQDPDTMYVWFYGGSVVNFNHINDATMNKALDDGRSEPDPAARKTDYETFNKRLASQAYTLWSYYETWYIAHTDKVKNILGPNLPDANGEVGTEKPAQILAGYHQLLGMWKSS
jgi:peptide/nickel transport system substrate-binding protein